MPTIETVKMYAMYVIGEVESNWDWTGCYRVDPITLGMMQWYGLNGRDLLAACKVGDSAGYTTFAASAPQLAADVDAHADDWDWWTGRYVNDEEANAWVVMAERVENHKIQQERWMQDCDYYFDKLGKLGVPIANSKPLIFAMCMYHQSPRNCGYVLGSCGGSADLERMYTTCMNDGILGNYVNRYTTARDRLASWDGESMPPDFGQSGTPSSGGNPPSVEEKKSQLGYIIQIGNDLMLYGAGDEYKNGVIFHAASGQRWINGYNANGTPIEGGNTGGGTSTGTEAQTKICDLVKSWDSQFAYSQGAGRMNPLESGYTDCSALLWFAYQQVAGKEIGSWTGAQVNNGTEIAVGSGALPLDKMQPADLLLMNWSGYNPSYDHVEMYTGDNTLWGHGGPGNGPTLKADASAYASYGTDWMVRRYL